MGSAHGPANAYARAGFRRAQGARSAHRTQCAFRLKIMLPTIERNGHGWGELTAVSNENDLQLHSVSDNVIATGLDRNSKMIEPRRSGDVLFHNVARVLTYVAFTAIGAAAVFIFIMVLEYR